MIKKKLESLKSSKFTAFKLSGINPTFPRPQYLWMTFMQDGRDYEKDKHDSSETQHHQLNGKGEAYDIYGWKDNKWVYLG